MNSQVSESSGKELWILTLLPEKLPGKVTRRVGNNSLIIQPLVKALPLEDGTFARSFFAPSGNAREDEYVLFQWKTIGKRGFDSLKNKPGNPTAAHVEVVTENTANKVAEDVRQTISAKLREKLEERLSKVKTKEATIDSSVDERVKSKQLELESWASKLAQQEVNLKIEADKLAIETEEKERQLYKRVQQQEKIMSQRKAELISFSESIKHLQEESEKTRQSIEPYRLAVPKLAKAMVACTERSAIPENLASKWLFALDNSKLILPKPLASSYFVSLISAFYSGSLVLLNGPVGVGKTSIVKESAKLLGGNSKIIPVRPAWLDPTDLLGFFDPIKEVFRPSPFLNSLKDAGESPNDLCLICLDELNLARIENYGADVLSALEYSRTAHIAQRVPEEKQGLLLYSESIETELWEEARFLNEKAERSGREIQRLKQLQKLLSDYRANFELSSNTVILGTLNSDETTYDISPKIIDRAYVINYPVADLTSRLSTLSLESTEALNLSVSSLTHSIGDFLRLASQPESVEQLEMTKITKGIEGGWQRVLQWNNLLSDLGIPLGHRASRDFKVVYAVCYLLGLSYQDCLGHFLFVKLLPRISFLKSSDTQDKFNQLLNVIRKDFEKLGTSVDNYDPGDVLHQLTIQASDNRRQYVRYWIRT